MNSLASLVTFITVALPIEAGDIQHAGKYMAVRWVPMTERMPTNHGEYFILIELRSTGQKMMGAAQFNGKDWMLLGANITHWLEGLRLP